jgi:hypothetical protein
MAALADATQRWDLGDAVQLRVVLQKLMPGEWDSRHVSRLAGAIAAAQVAAEAERALPLAETTPGEVQFLLSRVFLQRCTHVLE